jgi:hypothetical protein
MSTVVMPVESRTVSPNNVLMQVHMGDEGTASRRILIALLGGC